MESSSIKFSRELNKLSPEEVANAMNISVEDYIKIEKGETIPTKDFLTDLSDLFGEDFVNREPLRNIKIFDVLYDFYNLQVIFRNIKKKFEFTEKYENFLDSCIYRKGLIYPKSLDKLNLNLTSTELSLFSESIEVLKLKLQLLDNSLNQK